MFSSFYGIKNSDSSLKPDMNLLAQKLDKIDLLIDKYLVLGQQSLAQYNYLSIIMSFVLSVLAQSIM